MSRIPMLSRVRAVPTAPESGTACAGRSLCRRCQSSEAIGGEADIPRTRRTCRSDVIDLACVKTHTSAKCKKYNSPVRRCAARPQHDLTPHHAQFLRDILCVRPTLEFSHRQDPKRTPSTLTGRSRSAPKPRIRLGVTAWVCRSSAFRHASDLESIAQAPHEC